MASTSEDRSPCLNAASGKDSSALAGKAAATLSGEQVSESTNAGPKTDAAVAGKLTANLSEELASDFKSDDAATPADKLNANLSGERVTDVPKAESKPNAIMSAEHVTVADIDSAESKKQAPVDVGKLNANLSGERVTDVPKIENEETLQLAAKLHVNLSGEHVVEPEVAEPKAAELETAEQKAAEPKAAEPEAAEPKAAEPKAAEAEAAEPKAAEPKAAEPKAAEPKAAEPEAAEPKTAEPMVAEPNAQAPACKLNGNLSDDRVKDFKKAFEVHDAEGSGQIPSSELGAVMRSLGYKLTESDLQELLGPTPKASISFSEFIAMMTKDVLAMDAEDEFKQVFRVFDRNGDGFVSCAEIRQAMTTLGQKLSTEDVDEMIRVADKDAKGKLTFDEFVTMVTFK